ncbi:MAG: HEAT repeat domain-containing protein [Acidobacteriaceae bacterium]|nr:HEAT repeat domain-containing protein [Acidobacteriaceae bacterium]
MLTVSVLRFAVGFSLCSSLLLAQQEDHFDSKQRISRIHDLAKRGPSALPALQQDLSDPAREIRVEAVKAIVKIGTVDSLAPLAKAAHGNDAEVQIRATDGIVNYYVPGYVVKGALSGTFVRGVRSVKSFFNSRNDQVVDADVFIRQDVAQALADQVAGGVSMDVRANAALASGILRNRTAVPSLVGSLRAQDNALIFESLVALQKIKDPAADPGLSAVATDLDERIQMTALETIGVLRSLPAAPAVRTALANARNTSIRRAALLALARLGIPGDRTTFHQYSSNQDPELRASALEGLGRIREPEDYPILEKAYNEPNAGWRVHLAAAFGLVNEGNVSTAEFSPLPFVLENVENPNHAGVASPYLTELCRREDVRKALIPLVSQATKDQKLAICAAFGAAQEEDAIPVLNSLAKDIDPDVAFAASKALRIAQARRSS